MCFSASTLHAHISVDYCLIFLVINIISMYTRTYHSSVVSDRLRYPATVTSASGFTVTSLFSGNAYTTPQDTQRRRQEDKPRDNSTTTHTEDKTGGRG
jgi:hypothetical protein